MARFSWRKWFGVESRRTYRKQPRATSLPRVEALENRLVPSTLLDNVNGSRNPVNGNSWFATDTGWNFTPSTSYSLNEIGTTFAQNYSGGQYYNGYWHSYYTSVRLEIRDGGPGGSVLRTSAAQSEAEYYGGSYVFAFSPLTFTAGHTYFIGFRNVANVGVNVTSDSGATNLGYIYYDFNNSDTYSNYETGSTAQPILNFYHYGPPVYFQSYPGYSNSTSATFTWQATDEGYGVASFRYQLDGGSYGSTWNLGSNNGSVSFTGLAPKEACPPRLGDRGV
jgi:hypothetical protein